MTLLNESAASHVRNVEVRREIQNHELSTASRTEWMPGLWGLMVHWIAPGPKPERGEWIEDLNTAVDAFDLDGFLADFASTSADFLMFTVGQNTGFYASPNATLDALAGPGHCSRRDLVMEIARGVKSLGKRLILYLPGEVNRPVSVHEAFAWNPEDQSEFQRRYTAFIAEYSRRFGNLVDGWWFDGCYEWPEFPNKDRDWALWIAAARTGNPEAPVAFNDGCYYCGFVKPPYPEQDYLSGECWDIMDGKIVVGHEGETSTLWPTERYVTGSQCQFHLQIPIDLDGLWYHEQTGTMAGPRYVDEELFPLLNRTLDVGGLVTLNAGVYQNGRINPPTLEQLRRLTAQRSERTKGSTVGAGLLRS